MYHLLLDLRDGHFLRGHVNAHWVAQDFLGKLRNLSGHGGGKQ